MSIYLFCHLHSVFASVVLVFSVVFLLCFYFATVVFNVAAIKMQLSFGKLNFSVLLCQRSLHLDILL